ncbi:DUF397 domain-containing protein [Streptomyces sp. NBC_01591]|uniref:DUF397 domain-containing protein n=1 Tax=Streptomyces sp. NBC_01591 TaxID=2975888 RepID=UPI002DD90DE0|nr:DUF397 domain-containing protein [Streptomyces sp. NBC_01591]WSD68666.1 DUF397 domain-containing protein [Streptomyces sp. NBC_01591]
MPEAPNWRTSTYTSHDNCVEVSDNQPAAVMVRDSKNRERAILHIPPGSWSVFVEFSKSHGFSLALNQ